MYLIYDYVNFQTYFVKFGTIILYQSMFILKVIGVSLIGLTLKWFSVHFAKFNLFNVELT